MPSRPKRECRVHGCANTHRNLNGYCDAHAALAPKPFQRYHETHPDVRPTAAARGYNSPWRRAAAGHLQNHPYCVSCGGRATRVDHDPPHNGDMKAFWDRSRWRPMCEACHNRKTRLEKPPRSFSHGGAETAGGNKTCKNAKSGHRGYP